MQSSSGSLPFKPSLAGASTATDAILEIRNPKVDIRMISIGLRNSAFGFFRGSQGVISSARRSAKAEVRGANPRESTIFKLRMQNIEWGMDRAKSDFILHSALRTLPSK